MSQEKNTNVKLFQFTNNHWILLKKLHVQLNQPDETS